MTREGRKSVSPPTANPWESTLRKLDHTEPSQAGEVPAGLEEGLGGGDKGIDAITGGGGYGGDAAESGHDAALAEPERPIDSEITGDPRTKLGSPYPDDAKRSDENQGPIGESEVVEGEGIEGEIVEGNRDVEGERPQK